MMLSRTVSEWWTTTSIAVTFLAALVFLVRSIIEYRSSRSAPKDSEHSRSFEWRGPLCG